MSVYYYLIVSWFVVSISIKKEGKEVPVAMQAIWDYEHEKMIDNAKEVKMLIFMYKE